MTTNRLWIVGLVVLSTLSCGGTGSSPENWTTSGHPSTDLSILRQQRWSERAASAPGDFEVKLRMPWELESPESFDVVTNAVTLAVGGHGLVVRNNQLLISKMLGLLSKKQDGTLKDDDLPVVTKDALGLAQADDVNEQELMRHVQGHREDYLNALTRWNQYGRVWLEEGVTVVIVPSETGQPRFAYHKGIRFSFEQGSREVSVLVIPLEALLAVKDTDGDLFTVIVRRIRDERDREKLTSDEFNNWKTNVIAAVQERTRPYVKQLIEKRQALDAKPPDLHKQVRGLKLFAEVLWSRMLEAEEVIQRDQPLHKVYFHSQLENEMKNVDAIESSVSWFQRQLAKVGDLTAEGVENQLEELIRWSQQSDDSITRIRESLLQWALELMQATRPARPLEEDDGVYSKRLGVLPNATAEAIQQAYRNNISAMLRSEELPDQIMGRLFEGGASIETILRHPEYSEANEKLQTLNTARDRLLATAHRTDVQPSRQPRPSDSTSPRHALPSSQRDILAVDFAL